MQPLAKYHTHDEDRSSRDSASMDELTAEGGSFHLVVRFDSLCSNFVSVQVAMIDQGRRRAGQTAYATGIRE
jgi:hypothetical protein